MTTVPLNLGHPFVTVFYSTKQDANDPFNASELPLTSRAYWAPMTMLTLEGRAQSWYEIDGTDRTNLDVLTPDHVLMPGSVVHKIGTAKFGIDVLDYPYAAYCLHFATRRYWPSVHKFPGMLGPYPESRPFFIYEGGLDIEDASYEAPALADLKAGNVLESRNPCKAVMLHEDEGRWERLRDLHV